MLCAVAPVLHVLPPDALEDKVTLPPWQKVVDPPAVIVGEGLLFTVTVTGEDVEEHPLLFVTETVKTPVLVTVMLCEAALLLQLLPLEALEVSTTLPPWQKVVGPPALIEAVGFEFTVTVTGDEVPPHPLLSVTVYVPDEVTVMLCVVAPVLHALLLLMLEVSITLPPWQKVVGPPAVTAGMLFGLTLTMIVFEVAVHPFELISDTE